jgi:hypothetical protein
MGLSRPVMGLLYPHINIGEVVRYQQLVNTEEIKNRK